MNKLRKLNLNRILHFMLNSSLVAKVWNRFGSVAFAIFIEILNSVHRKRCVCHYPKSSHSSAFSAFWRPPATLDTWPNKWDASGNEFEMIDLASQQERRLAGWLSCWRCSSGGIAKWNSVFRFSPFVIRRSSRTWTRPRLKFSAPASVRGRLVHDCRLSDVEWRRKGKKSLNGKWAPAADLDSCSISGIVWLASGYTKLGYGQRMRTRWDSLAHLTLPTWHSLHSIPFFFSFRRNWWKTNQGRLSTALQKWVSPDLSITIS